MVRFHKSDPADEALDRLPIGHAHFVRGPEGKTRQAGGVMKLVGAAADLSKGVVRRACTPVIAGS